MPLAVLAACKFQPTAATSSGDAPLAHDGAIDSLPLDASRPAAAAARSAACTSTRAPAPSPSTERWARRSPTPARPRRTRSRPFS